ncbi:hypothetical protein C1H46_018845 [Malus baccata]|uniref:Uncharacterized protein n=1 Tax=Malus baccata TaxID=106549 RepID=A0A540MAH6_MALBA|nr:hypothetical protein C1H46_018845 [Malus baccata]
MLDLITLIIPTNITDLPFITLKFKYESYIKSSKKLYKNRKTIRIVHCWV